MRNIKVGERGGIWSSIESCAFFTDLKIAYGEKAILDIKIEFFIRLFDLRISFFGFSPYFECRVSHQLVPSQSDGSGPAAATVPAASTGTKPRTVDSVETVSTRKGKTAKVRVSVNG